MSWSVTVIGEPPKVAKALEEYAATLDGQSRKEFESVKAHFQAILEQIIGGGRLVEITACGHANFDAQTGEKTYGEVQVSVKPFWAKLAV